jgi:hypothetical protein
MIEATQKNRTLYSILIIVEDTDRVEGSEIQRNHVFEVSPRLITHNIAGLESGNIRYLFVGLNNANHIWPRLGSTEYGVFVYERKGMETLAGIEWSPIRILATRSELQHLKTTSSWYGRPAFNCPQWPAFEQAFKSYTRHRFGLMDKINKDTDINFQFLTKLMDKINKDTDTQTSKYLATL